MRIWTSESWKLALLVATSAVGMSMVLQVSAMETPVRPSAGEGAVKAPGTDILKRDISDFWDWQSHVHFPMNTQIIQAMNDRQASLPVAPTGPAAGFPGFASAPNPNFLLPPAMVSDLGLLKGADSPTLFDFPARWLPQPGLKAGRLY